jgi:hypothetical protein
MKVKHVFLVNESVPETFMDIQNAIGKALLYAGKNDLSIDRIYAGARQHRILRYNHHNLTMDDVMRKKEGAQVIFRGVQIYNVTDQPDHWTTILIPRHEH